MKNAPSPRLVFTYLIGGIFSFVVLAGWSALNYAEWGGFYANPRLLAWVHLAVLGWINLAIFGVLFQFVPVVLNVRLGSEKLAWWQLGFYVPGAAGMIVCFWIGRLDWPLHTFATFLWVGFALFIWNMLVTYRRLKQWTLTAKCVYAAVLHLLATIMLGLFLSIHIAYPMIEMSHLTLLKLHAHAGMAGWLLMIVMGVSIKLLPMFLLSHDYSTRSGTAAFYLVNAGLLGWGVAVALEAPLAWQQPGALLLALGVGCYLAQVAAIYRGRNRVRSDPFRRQSVRRVHFPLRFAAAAYAVLGTVLLAGLALVIFRDVLSPGFRNQLVLIYGASLFLGFLGLLIQALLYKIVPFLVWLNEFSASAGKVRTPRVDDLVPRRSAVAQLLVYCAGTVVAIVSLVVDLPALTGAGALFILAGSVWLAVNLVVAWKRAVPLGPLAPSARCEPPPDCAHESAGAD